MRQQKCKCEDSNGVVCGKLMTQEEQENVWEEMHNNPSHKWEHALNKEKEQ